MQLSLRLDKLRHSVSTDPMMVTDMETLRADAQVHGEFARRETEAMGHELETLIEASQFAANEAYAHVRYVRVGLFCVYGRALVPYDGSLLPCDRVGLFCVMVGLLCRMMGLFCHVIGLLCRMIGLL